MENDDCKRALRIEFYPIIVQLVLMLIYSIVGYALPGLILVVFIITILNIPFQIKGLTKGIRTFKKGVDAIGEKGMMLSAIAISFPIAYFFAFIVSILYVTGSLNSLIYMFLKY
jgi:hypothetical protein